jgi:hypothetical protein
VVDTGPGDPDASGDADTIGRVDVEAARRPHLYALVDDDDGFALARLQIGTEGTRCRAGRRVLATGQVQRKRTGAPASGTLFRDQVVVERLGIGEL